MKSLLLIPLVAQACIIYEHDRVFGCRDCDDTDDSGHTTEEPFEDEPAGGNTGGGNGGSGGSGGSGGVPQAPPPAYAFALSVDSAPQGDILITVLTSVGDPLDLHTVDTVDFLGDVSLQDALVRTGEILLALHVEDDAVPGTDPVLVEVDGTAWLIDGGFTVLERSDDTSTAPALCP